MIAGSFNDTCVANDYNDENIFVIGSPHPDLPKSEGGPVDVDECAAICAFFRDEIDRIIFGLGKRLSIDQVGTRRSGIGNVVRAALGRVARRPQGKSPGDGAFPRVIGRSSCRTTTPLRCSARNRFALTCLTQSEQLRQF